jgi:ligand-binding sensor domain-containing protein
VKKNLKYRQWLVFLLIAWLPLALLAADAGTPPALPALSLTPARDFAYTEPEFESLRDTESIDGRSITALAQDARGLIWIGTQAGLVRYDGYRFRKFIPNAADPLSLAGYFISSLLVTKDGRLWVGTLSDGISVFDPASERFEHFRHDEKAPHSVGGGRIWALANDDQRGGMWIANDQGLDFLPTGSKRFVHFRHNTDPHSLMEGRVRSLLLDKTGRLWVGGGNSLQRMNKDGKHFETVVSDKEIQTLFQAQDGKLWLGTRSHGAAWLVPGAASPQASWLPLAQLSHPWITGIEQVESGQILLATYGGGIIMVAASDGQVMQTLRHDPALAASLVADTLGPLLQDRAGSLWVGTWGRGLQRMNTDNAVRRLLRHSPNRPNGLSRPDVRIMLELADGRLLIGNRGNGIDIFDRQRGLIGGYRADQGRTGALPDATIYALAQSRDGSIWAGTQLAGVVRQLAGQTAWVPVPGLPNKKVNKLFASRDGSVWAGTDRGVARWRPSGQAPLSAGQENPPARFEILMDEQGKAMETAVSALAEDGQGRIWIGTNNGLWLYEPGAKGPIRIQTEPKQADGLISDFILCLLVDSHDRLWVATDKRLERLKSLNGNHARFEHGGNRLDMVQGGSLLEDQQGRIWTELSVINPEKMTLPPLPFDPGELGAHPITSYAKTRDGLLLFGGTEGMAIIDPARFKAYEYAPPLAVTELKINGKAVAPASLVNPLINPLINPLAQTRPDTQANAAASLTLTPDQRNFSIEFAALDYSEPKKNRYQYRLQGYEKDWISTDADNRSATYGNLWPGLYTLQVRGSNRLAACRT